LKIIKLELYIPYTQVVNIGLGANMMHPFMKMGYKQPLKALHFKSVIIRVEQIRAKVSTHWANRTRVNLERLIIIQRKTS
jgi:hypothetical protein